MRQIAALVLLWVMAPGCSLALPQPEPEPVERPIPAMDDPPEMVEPPELVINGVAGKPVSWCWVSGCVDGWLHAPALAPAVAAPFEVQLPEDSRIESVAAIGPGAPGRQKRVEVPFDGTSIGAIPDGAIMLNVAVRFAAGGDASYFWALNRDPDIAPSGVAGPSARANRTHWPLWEPARAWFPSRGELIAVVI